MKPPTVIGSEPIEHLKPPAPASALAHRDIPEGPFWQKVPGFKDVDEATFLDHNWQAQNTIISPKQLIALVEPIAPAGFAEDLDRGFHKAPMSLRISPNMFSLIDWTDPIKDPIRRQFVPLASQMLPDHPKLTLDSLHEQADAPVPGFTHRYPDKALLLSQDLCPTYCRFCTRSYAVGIDTDIVEKVNIRPQKERWERAFQYIRERPELEDIVVSGGDSFMLRADQLAFIGQALLDIPHVRRIRVATKGLAVMPMKILTDTAWTDALTQMVERGRKLHKSVVVHTHFNTPREVTWISQKALNLLFERGIIVRNQTVLQRGVNDNVDTMQLLVKRLGHCNVQPYYVYIHDLVKGVEELRTTVQTAVNLEKAVRGITAGFNTPNFVCDAPGGGGKRIIHSYEHYNRETGIAVYKAPSVRPGCFLYFDPLQDLSPEVQARWADPVEREIMVQAALDAVK